MYTEQELFKIADSFLENGANISVRVATTELLFG